MSLNKVQLIGYVGADPDIQALNLGRKTARFRIATSKWTRKEDKELESVAVWHSIVCWDKLAEYVEKSVKKGDKIYIEGEISYRTYKSNNIEQTYTNIIASEIIMLKRKTDNNEEAQ
ncbi:MAG: single-stranded DNA-binding protein [Alistipes sp.]|nr:single-stranded DNA-binding protein [Alistipes sp.]